MPPVFHDSADASGPSGGQQGVPRDSEELHDRTHRFLAAVGPALDSIEGLLDSWNRFRETSASSSGLPEKSSFRAVNIDPFTVHRPPPSVTEAEITQYIKKLSKKDLKVLHDEYELTCVDDFEYVQAEAEEGSETAAQVAARIVHFADEPSVEATTANSEEGNTVSAEMSGGAISDQPIPIGVSRTTRARTLFEEDGASVERLNVRPDGGLEEVRMAATAGDLGDRAAHTMAPPPRTPPAYSLDQMTPSAVAAHERRRSGSSDSSSSSSDGGLRTRSPTRAEAPAKESYTVEIEYGADHFFPSEAQRALRDNASSAIMIKPGTHPLMRHGVRAGSAFTKVVGPLQLESDDEESKSEADIQSFTTFSRMVLANEGRRLISQRAQAEATAAADVPRPIDAFIQATPAASTMKASPLPAGKSSASAAAPGTAAPAPSASTDATAANTVSVKVMRNVDPASGRDAFVRRRVHDIILANRVRTADAAALGEAFFARLDNAWNAAANRTTPVLRRLDEMVCEASALLHMLEVMDHQAYRERVMDPAQFLCVPRYSAVCAAPDCGATFSATVTRVMCGRCGQFFCPACCAERGVGPDVVCESQRYSLGWEPLCRVCFQMCRDTQERLVQERNQYLRIESAAAYHDPAGDGDGEEEAARRASADSLTLKQAVLFGAYCDEQRCLSDGLPPFYVMDRKANERVAFWDILGYQFAKSQGTLRRGWQSAGSMAAHAVQNAAQMISRRPANKRLN